MAKTNKTTPKASQPSSAVVVQDLSIDVRTIDRSPKDLARWKQALLSAENLLSPMRKQLYDLYADIDLDEHLTSVLDQRRASLTNSSLVFQKDGEEIPEVNRLINTLGFERMIHYIIDSKFYGYSLIHADFVGNGLEPVIELVPRAHVVPEFNLVVRNPGDTQGINFKEPPYTTLYLGVGEPKDLGLLLKASPLVLLKRGNVSDWAAFNEVFGQPIRKGTYGPGDPQQKAQLEQALSNMGSMSWIAVPEGSNLEILGNYQSASADTYSKLTDHFDSAISKLIVGQTMTTDSGSSLSQSEVHERTGNKIGYSDRRFVLKVLESVVKPMLIAQGFPASEGNFQFIEEEANVSKKDRLAGDIQIHEKVGKIKKEYWAKEYNIAFVDDADPDPDAELEPKPEPNNEPTGDELPEEKTEKQPGKPKTNETQKNAADLNPFSVRGLLGTLQSFFSKAPIR